ncbi:SusC/RagA family TonB-linked outer membrane protein [Dokdonia sp. Hel_I_53]|uniref:SusC/RagA family TonB-linked outer membrane protein n=1 Tax=Dokdonia sp. Hel_I_53 TaxID=1566287 RepID=UPI00119A102D|nr:SusC/RagA family TonB-linked outer membrane protein [Dokdonia sp. Hel_I_53]TVZ52057.1 TonB-linked SusC/RagA family outer membrane protein [Dokdonia sp. Hel_I_53]
MKTKFNGILTLLLAFVVQISFAQTTVSGTVSEENGPLPGANVIIKGTTTGTQTDFDGNYSINANPTDVLIFSFVGFTTQEVAVGGQNTINVSLAADNTLEEVIVTAQGIKREKKALGYAVATLDSESIEAKPDADVVRQLNGKISGVQITSTSGAAGSGTNFIIRSKSSINGNNQPLFVVDGVPFDAGTNSNGAGFGDGGTTTSSRFLDLDPNNIESLSVLKGLSASVLYGQRGRNGVVLITTKTGSSGDPDDADKKFEVTFSQTSYATQISNLPDYQNEYGQGADNIFNPAFVGNWGASYDSLDQVAHPYNAEVNGNFAFPDVFPQFQGRFIDYKPANAAGDFFKTAYGSSTSVSASKSSGKASYNTSFGYTDEDGYVPGNNLKRYNFALGGRAQLTNKLTFDGSILISNNRVQTPPIGANNAAGAISIFERTLFVPRQIDLASLPFQHPVTGENVYYRTDQNNPYWLVNNARDYNRTDRAFISSGLSYELTDKINFNYRLGLDTYNEYQERRVNKGAVGDATYSQGYLRQIQSRNRIFNQNFSVAFTDIDFSESIGFQAQIGAELRNDQNNTFGSSSTDQIVFDVFTTRNFATQNNNDPFVGNLDFQAEENILGAYANLSFDFKNQLFLNLTGRNDWGSTLEKENRSIFYPGASLSWIPTTTFSGLREGPLDFLKLRASFGSSARFPGPFNTRAILLATAQAFNAPNGNISTNSLSNVRPNPELDAELQREYEVGLESNLFNNRLNLEVTLYTREAEDQILNQSLAPSTGFTSTLINAGTLNTDGIEIGLNFIPLRSKNGNFEYSVSNIFDAYETTVTDLPVENIVFAGFTTLGNFAINDQPLGVIQGSAAARDDEGNLLINPTSGAIFDTVDDFNEDIEIIGDPNPDFRLTSIHSFQYKNFSLSGQFEYVHGGDIYSQTTTQLLRRGVTTANSGGRENTYIIPGVLADPATGDPLLDANGNKIANNIQVGANDLYFLNLVDPAGQGIYDGTHFRIREVSLGYSVPKVFLDKTPLGSLSLTASGQNLFVKAFNFPDAINFDPEQLSTGVGNGQGLDFQTGPTTRRFALALKATF